MTNAPDFYPAYTTIGACSRGKNQVANEEKLFHIRSILLNRRYNKQEEKENKEKKKKNNNFFRLSLCKLVAFFFFPQV